MIVINRNFRKVKGFYEIKNKSGKIIFIYGSACFTADSQINQLLFLLRGAA